MRKMKFLFNILKDTNSKIVLTTIILLALLEFSLGLAIYKITDIYNTYLLDEIIKYALVLSLICILIFLMQYLVSKGMYLLEINYFRNLTSNLIKNLSTKKYSYIEEYKADNVLTLFISDCEEVAKSFTSVLLSTFSGLILFLAAIIVGFIVSIKLTLFSLVLCPLSVLVPKYFEKKLEATWQDRQESQEEMNASLLQVFENKLLFKVFNSENFAIKLLMNKYKKFTNDNIENAKLSWKIITINTFFGLLFDILNMMFSFYLIYNNELTIAGFIAFSILIKNFTWLFYDFPNNVVAIKKGKVSYDRITSFINTENDNEVRDFDKPIKELRVDNISFTYNNESLVFDNLSFILKEKEKIAIVGESGSGKSTLLKILLGFYKTSSGNIFVDNKKVDLANSYFSYVPQKIEVFTDTVKNNIALGRDISNEDFDKIIKLTKLDEVFENLPNGVDTILNNQQKLSAGQLQLLGIARALVEDKLLILDEPLANLDRKNEYLVISVLEKIKRGVIIVSHRVENLSNFKVYKLS